MWVSPYYEDDLLALRDAIGADRILFGSDYPHAEGLADPSSFVNDLDGFTDDEIRLIMRENALALRDRERGAGGAVSATAVTAEVLDHASHNRLSSARRSRSWSSTRVRSSPNATRPGPMPRPR